MPEPESKSVNGTSSRPWWESGVVYQIYPRSFQDSDGDGIGDLAGSSSGSTISPRSGSTPSGCRRSSPRRWPISATTSPTIAGIEPMFGTLADFDRLLAAVHARGLKLLLDFVPNHSRDRIPGSSRAARRRTSAKRDWYIWRDRRGPTAARRTTGSATSAARPGTGTRPPANITSTPSSSSSPTSTGAIPAVQRGDARRDALLVRARRRRVPHRRAVAHRQGRRLSRQSGQSRLAPGHERARPRAPASLDRPARGACNRRPRCARLPTHYGERVLVGEIFLPNERLARWYGTPTAPQVHLPFNFALIENAVERDDDRRADRRL